MSEETTMNNDTLTPLAPQENETGDVLASASVEAQNQKTIMVVEDDLFISDIYDVRLSAAGFKVVIAGNGREALDKLREGIRPDVMLLDIIMPYVDGFDVLDAVMKNEEWKTIPVILLTNLSQKEDIDRAITMGAKDYLIKSHFTPTEVLSKISKYVS